MSAFHLNPFLNQKKLSSISVRTFDRVCSFGSAARGEKILGGILY